MYLSSPTFQVLPSQRAATTKTKELPEKESTVYSAKSIHCLYKGTVKHGVFVLLHYVCGGLYTCALYIFRSPLLGRSNFRVQICGESTLGLNLRDLSVFFSFFEFLYEQCINAVGQTRFNCSDHLFIRGVFSTQPMFQSMEPTGACQVYILPRHQATSIFDKKIWRKKTRIVTFSGKLYIVSSIVCHLTKLENMGLFLY